MPEDLSSYVEENCSELVERFNNLDNQSSQLIDLRQQLVEEINGLSPKTKADFEKIVNPTRELLSVSFVYEETNLNDSWSKAK